jgi:hypothetical protein
LTTNTIRDTIETSKASEQIQSLAWMIVVISFVLFCSISIAASGGIYYFLFRSTIPMDVVLQVGRGTVPVMTVDSEQVVRSRSAPFDLVSRGSIVSIDAQSQATISFQIPDEDEVLTLATITLQNNSNIAFTSAHRPRFEWSEGFYGVDMSDFVGEADILVTQSPDRKFSLRIQTSVGNATFLIDEPGRYSIAANETSIQLITFEGQEAVLLSPLAEQNRLVLGGEQAILRTGGNVPIVSAAPINLLENGLFTFEIVPAEEGNLLPQRWACFRVSEAPPTGDWQIDKWQGRPALRLILDADATTTSRTGCRQTVGIDVTEYSLLELKATFLLNFQSLQNCGQDGTECPMMLFVKYTDINGIQRSWSQGIFYNFDPQSSYPLICRTCATTNEHRQISEQVWYTYESGNLFNRLPPEERPASIEQVEFYASGHQYDVFVSEIALFAGIEQVIPPAPQEDD